MKTLWFAIAAVVLLLLSGSAYIVHEGEVGVLFQFGRIVRTDIAPGLHFKLPLVQDVLRFDRRIYTLNAEPDRYMTQEKKDVSVDYYAKWKIRDVSRYYTATLGSEVSAEQRLTPIVKEALKNTINQRGLQDLVSIEREVLGGDMLRGVNRAAESLGIEVVDIRISRIDLPDDGNLLESVYERMRAERTRVANQLRAEGDEASSKIRAEAERQRQVIAAEAERDAQVLRGEGDAAAAATSAAAYGQDPEFYSFYRSLETYRKAFTDGHDVLVLDPDSELMRYFENAGRAAPAK
jgi:membrane protease subunit HflC